MDFEYQNKTGPLDARSPFAQLSQNAQRNHMMGTPGGRSKCGASVWNSAAKD